MAPKKKNTTKAKTAPKEKPAKKDKGKKKADPKPESDEEEVEVVDETGAYQKVKYILLLLLLSLEESLTAVSSWKEGSELSEKLISTITDDPKIKQGLFPAPGSNASSAKGGGAKKTHWHWKVAEALFSKHPNYAQAISSALDEKDTKVRGKLQNMWDKKIKNQIKAMMLITWEYIAVLGMTGEGITREEDINMEAKNEFMNKWKEIKEVCPWFFAMRELIGERPNVIPTGIGHSGDRGIDLSVLEDSLADGNADGILDDELSKEILASDLIAEGAHLPTTDDDGADATTSDEFTSSKSKPADDDVPDDNVEERRSKAEKQKAEGTSRESKACATKKSKLDVFAGAAEAEEHTRQKELDLAWAKVSSTASVALARQKIKLETKKLKAEEKRLEAEERKMKLEAENEQARQKHKQAVLRLQL